MNILKSIFRSIFGYNYNKEKIFDNIGNGVFHIIDALIHIENRCETDYDKKVIADFVQDNTTPVIITIKKGCPALTKLCMEYANANWDIEIFRTIVIIESQQNELKRLKNKNQGNNYEN